MSLLPLAATAIITEAGPMNFTDPRPRGEPERMTRGPHLPLRRLAHRVGAVISEATYAQQRLTSLIAAYDSYLTEPDLPPEHYAEFLLRTSGLLLHEPSAHQRLAGRGIR
jgi:hypothetical protein